MVKYLSSFLVGIGVLFLVVATTFAANGYTFFGDAGYIMPGLSSLRAVKLVSECPSGSPTCFGDGSFTFSGISFEVPAGMTFSGLDALSTDLKVTVNDCLGGSPRFQIGVDNTGDGVRDGNVFVYIGDHPNFDNCPTDWGNTGNLIESSDLRFDSTQFGGSFYGTFADAEALVGEDAVVSISLVLDSGWIFSDLQQEVLVDNVVINDTTYDFEPTQEELKQMCKKGGWKNFTNPEFKNQGQCVSHVVSKRP